MDSNYPANLDELVQDMEMHPYQYQHLKIFLRRENNIDNTDFGEEYLAVSHNGFAVYRLDSVDYQNGRVLLSLTEQSTNQTVKYSVDINNEQQSCIFLRWKDIKNMVFNECMKTNRNDSDLLELIE